MICAKQRKEIQEGIGNARDIDGTDSAQLDRSILFNNKFKKAETHAFNNTYAQEGGTKAGSGPHHWALDSKPLPHLTRHCYTRH